jgi:LysM repeat protein
MKILKICGLVVAVHLFGIILLLAIPGCSSTKSAPAPTDPVAKADPGPVVAAAPSGGGDAPLISAAPAAPAPDITPVVPPVGNTFFSPTRPGTPAAAALEAQPVADVTPARTYVVAPGDSLWTIAKKNHLKVSELASANNLKSGTPLRPGRKLLIPSKGETAPEPSAPSMAPAPSGAGLTGGPAAGAPAMAKTATAETKYTVKNNETLGAIARKFHLRVADLATRNNISDPQKIRPGQELIIPAGGTTGTKRTPRSGSAAPKPAAASAAPVAPPPDQDLDAGAGAAANGGVPVITISPAPTAPDAPVPAK